jgi:tripartite-type tricarboxylate transporter receptor subunit TctC
MRRRAAVAGLLAAMFCGAAAPAAAQTYPDRIIKMIVGYPAGGPIDVTARVVGQKMSSILGQPIVIENRTGATGTVAAKVFVNAAPDGYTLLYGNASQLSVNPAIARYRDFDATKHFAPIAKITEGYEVLVVDPNGPAKTVRELVAHAKANPGRLNFGSAGFGNLTHLSAELLKLRTGIDIVHVPYKGAPEAVGGLLGGQVHLLFGEVAGLLPLVRDGKVRALAVASAQRAALAPDLPTMAEEGIADFVVLTFTGLLAPAGTPPPIVERLTAAVRAAVAAPETSAALRRLGAEVRVGSPAEFAAFLAAEKVKWDDVVHRTGIKME